MDKEVFRSFWGALVGFENTFLVLSDENMFALGKLWLS